MLQLNLIWLFSKLIDLYIYIILIRVILSYIRLNPYNPVVNIIHRMTDPLFDFIKRYIPCQYGMMDFSPIIVIVLLSLIKRIVSGLFY